MVFLKMFVRSVIIIVLCVSRLSVVYSASEVPSAAAGAGVGVTAAAALDIASMSSEELSALLRPDDLVALLTGKQPTEVELTDASNAESIALPDGTKTTAVLEWGEASKPNSLKGISSFHLCGKEYFLDYVDQYLSLFPNSDGHYSKIIKAIVNDADATAQTVLKTGYLKEEVIGLLKDIVSHAHELAEVRTHYRSNPFKQSELKAKPTTLRIQFFPDQSKYEYLKEGAVRRSSGLAMRIAEEDHEKSLKKAQKYSAAIRHNLVLLIRYINGLSPDVRSRIISVLGAAEVVARLHNKSDTIDRARLRAPVDPKKLRSYRGEDRFNPYVMKPSPFAQLQKYSAVVDSPRGTAAIHIALSVVSVVVGRVMALDDSLLKELFMTGLSRFFIGWGKQIIARSPLGEDAVARKIQEELRSVLAHPHFHGVPLPEVISCTMVSAEPSAIDDGVMSVNLSNRLVQSVPMTEHLCERFDSAEKVQMVMRSLLAHEMGHAKYYEPATFLFINQLLNCLLVCAISYVCIYPDVDNRQLLSILALIVRGFVVQQIAYMVTTGAMHRVVQAHEKRADIAAKRVIGGEAGALLHQALADDTVQMGRVADCLRGADWLNAQEVLSNPLIASGFCATHPKLQAQLRPLELCRFLTDEQKNAIRKSFQYKWSKFLNGVESYKANLLTSAAKAVRGALPCDNPLDFAHPLTHERIAFFEDEAAGAEDRYFNWLDRRILELSNGALRVRTAVGL